MTWRRVSIYLCKNQVVSLYVIVNTRTLMIRAISIHVIFMGDGANRDIK